MNVKLQITNTWLYYLYSKITIRFQITKLIHFNKYSNEKRFEIYFFPWKELTLDSNNNKQRITMTWINVFFLICNCFVNS